MAGSAGLRGDGGRKPVRSSYVQTGERPSTGLRRGALANGGLELLVLFTICLADTLSSALLFHYRLAVEANPLLRPFAEAGTLPFISAKVLTFFPALVATEWYREIRPHFVPRLLRSAAAAYVTVYAVLVLRQFWH